MLLRLKISLHRRNTIFIGTLVLSALFIFIYLTGQSPGVLSHLTAENLPQQKASAEEPEPTLKLEDQQQKNTSVTENIEIPEDLSLFRKALVSQAQKVGGIDSHPAETEQELTEMSSHLTPNQIRELRKLSIDTQQEGDLRSLSIFILSHSDGPESLAALREVALDPIELEAQPPGERQEALQIFEENIRALAIEGLESQSNIPSTLKVLDEITAKSNNSLLTDRAMRAKAHIQGIAPRIAEQEIQALRTMIKSKTYPSPRKDQESK